MPFPTTGILDTFAGADANPITTNWTSPARTGDQNLRIVSNTLRNEFQGAEGSAYYDLSQFGPDCEIYATLTTKPANDDQVRLYLRLKDVGTANIDAYEIRLTGLVGTDSVQIFRVDDNSATLLGSGFTQEFASGDALGGSVIDSTISAFRKPNGGQWTLIGSEVDSTYSGPGFLGVKMSQSDPSSPVLDDVGGGTCTVGPADAHPFARAGRGAGW